MWGLRGPVCWVWEGRGVCAVHEVSEAVLYPAPQTLCSGTWVSLPIENAPKLTKVMFLEDCFAHKSNYEMGKEFVSWHCPALNVLRTLDLRFWKSYLSLNRHMSFFRNSLESPCLVSMRSRWPVVEHDMRVLNSASTFQCFPAPLFHLSFLLMILRNEGGVAMLGLTGWVTVSAEKAPEGICPIPFLAKSWWSKLVGLTPHPQKHWWCLNYQCPGTPH